MNKHKVNRSRTKDTGVRLNEEEKTRFNKVCKELNVSLLEGFLKGLYKLEEVARSEKDL